MGELMEWDDGVLWFSDGEIKVAGGESKASVVSGDLGRREWIVGDDHLLVGCGVVGEGSGKAERGVDAKGKRQRLRPVLRDGQCAGIDECGARREGIGIGDGHLFIGKGTRGVERSG